MNYALKNKTGDVIRYQDFTDTPPVLPEGKGLTWIQEDPIAPVLSDEEILQQLIAAVQVHMDKTAAERGYGSILSACTYATDTNTKFRAEGQACVNWRGYVWSTCYQIMGEVKVGTRPIPTESQLIELLPSFVWPV